MMNPSPKQSRAEVMTMNNEKAVNHGGHSGHGETTRICISLINYQPGKTGKHRETNGFAVTAVFAVV